MNEFNALVDRVRALELLMGVIGNRAEDDAATWVKYVERIEKLEDGLFGRSSYPDFDLSGRAGAALAGRLTFLEKELGVHKDG